MAGALANREKCAYVLADSLRFEMGYDLARLLEPYGTIDVHFATAALPTITQVGMAALMPNVDGVIEFVQKGNEFVPSIGERQLKNINDRQSLLKEQLGDRVVDIEISQFLSHTNAINQEAELSDADLVVLRDSRIDALGETINPREARRFMTEMLSDLKAAVLQLARLGYSKVVIVSDHGHLMFPEILSGDVVTTPKGEWLLSKRRARLGKQVQEIPGSVVFPASQVGIHGDPAEFVTPKGFGTYSMGSGYFHGGLSLQEAVIPVLNFQSTLHPTEQSGDEINLRYRSDFFTSYVIGLKVWYNSLVSQELRVKIEAFSGSGRNARKIGEVAECDARDPLTYEVVLEAGKETAVPLLLDSDFEGDTIEIRATNPDAPVVWDKLTLKNNILD